MPDLFVKVPDVRFGARDPHVPPSINLDPTALTHRVVPMQPNAYRGPITLPAIPLPAIVHPSVVADAARRASVLRIASANAAAVADKARTIGGIAGSTVTRRLGDIRDSFRRG